MSGASPARVAALLTLSERRRRNGRVRDIERMSKQVGSLSAVDRALVTRLLMGTTATSALLDSLIDERLRRPSSVEPRVRDALQLAAFEGCYLDTPAASQAASNSSARAAVSFVEITTMFARSHRPRLPSFLRFRSTFSPLLLYWLPYTVDHCPRPGVVSAARRPPPSRGGLARAGNCAASLIENPIERRQGLTHGFELVAGRLAGLQIIQQQRHRCGLHRPGYAGLSQHRYFRAFRFRHDHTPHRSRRPRSLKSQCRRQASSAPGPR